MIVKSNGPSMVGTTVVRPAIREIHFTHLEKKDERIAKWGWVHIEELAKCLNDIFKKNGIHTIKHPLREIFDRYGLLCEEKDGKALFTYVASESYAIDDPEIPAHHEQNWLFIPAGWANRIIDVVNIDIVKVTWQFCPEIGHYQLVGHRYDGEQMAISVDGKEASTTSKIKSLFVITS